MNFLELMNIIYTFTSGAWYTCSLARIRKITLMEIYIPHYFQLNHTLNFIRSPAVERKKKKKYMPYFKLSPNNSDEAEY